MGGSYPIITGTGIDEMHDGKGIQLSKGLGSDVAKITLEWPQVEKRLSKLMKLDRCLNPKEKAYYPQWLEEQERKRADIAAERQLKEFLSRQPEEPKEYEYKYHLGDKVYIGASEYEITFFDDNRVTLFDSKFPLFGTEMPREEFDTKVKENPMNDHLKVVVEKKTENIPSVEVQPDTEQENTPASVDSDDLIGKNLTLDDRNFEVEKVSELGDVSLRDITFENANGFPISRVEKVEFVRNELETQQKKQTLTPTWEKPKSNKVTSFDLHPDVPYAQRHNFDLKSNVIETVGKKERFRRNMEAIRILKECEFDNRFATPDEQIILSKYVGWGGIPEAFDENNTAWEDEFKELYVALSPDEYAQARESTLTAFYTPPTVIKAIYKAMEQVGFKEGNLL